jgi:hypothetical protein
MMADGVVVLVVVVLLCDGRLGLSGSLDNFKTD